jgi:hypothetical protein
MRIAVTGTHGSGKTTLIENFTERFPGFAHEEEPSWALAQPGVVFADGASVPDLEDQLAQSVEMLLAPDEGVGVIFDRSPIDFLAYLEVVGEEDGVPWVPGERLLERIEMAIRSLDLLVFLPLSQPDEILAPIEFPRLRRRVDRRLKAMLRDDELDLFAAGRPRLLEIRGAPLRRLAALVQAAGAS